MGHQDKDTPAAPAENLGKQSAFISAAFDAANASLDKETLSFDELARVPVGNLPSLDPVARQTLLRHGQPTEELILEKGAYDTSVRYIGDKETQERFLSSCRSGIHITLEQSLLTFEQIIRLPLAKVEYLNSPALRILLKKGTLKFEELLALEGSELNKRTHELDTIINLGLILPTEALSLKQEQTEYLFRFRYLIKNQTLTAHQVGSLTQEQHDSIFGMMQLVNSSNVNNLPSGKWTTTGVLNPTANSKHIADVIKNMIDNGRLSRDQLLNEPKLPDFDNRVALLIVRGIVTLAKAKMIAAHSNRDNLCCDGIFQLLADGRKTVDDILSLSPEECAALDYDARGVAHKLYDETSRAIDGATRALDDVSAKVYVEASKAYDRAYKVFSSFFGGAETPAAPTAVAPEATGSPITQEPSSLTL